MIPMRDVLLWINNLWAYVDMMEILTVLLARKTDHSHSSCRLLRRRDHVPTKSNDGNDPSAAPEPWVFEAYVKGRSAQ